MDMLENIARLSRQYGSDPRFVFASDYPRPLNL